MLAQKTKKHRFWLQRNCPNENTIRHKVIISSTPILGPDRENKNDNYANAAFTYEGNEIRDFINRYNNVYIVTGDRHWQYVSHRADTNLWEFSTGPGSDVHAGGWKEDNRMPDHRFLRVKGGYLFGSVYAEEGRIRLKFQHRDVDSSIDQSIEYFRKYLEAHPEGAFHFVPSRRRVLTCQLPYPNGHFY